MRRKIGGDSQEQMAEAEIVSFRVISWWEEEKTNHEFTQNDTKGLTADQRWAQSGGSVECGRYRSRTVPTQEGDELT